MFRMANGYWEFSVGAASATFLLHVVGIGEYWSCEGVLLAVVGCGCDWIAGRTLLAPGLVSVSSSDNSPFASSCGKFAES